MTRIGLATFALLLSACKHAPPPADPQPGDDAPGDTAACGALDEEGCRADAACAVISGMAEHMTEPCVWPSRFAGCMAADTACGDALTHATDPAGDGWWFSDTCLPDGWTASVAPDGASEPPPGCDG